MTNFKETLVQIKKKVSCSPRKLPSIQLRQLLKSCNDISNVNRLLKYSGYDNCKTEEGNMQLDILAPS